MCAHAREGGAAVNAEEKAVEGVGATRLVRCSSFMDVPEDMVLCQMAFGSNVVREVIRPDATAAEADAARNRYEEEIARRGGGDQAVRSYLLRPVEPLTTV